MELILYTANCAGNRGNCIYPNKAVAGTPEELVKAIAYDHVAAKYKDNYRNTSNFISSTVVPMDCDNDHSGNPSDWVTPEKLIKDTELSDVSFVAVPSKSHMKPKGNLSARPRYHYFFLIDECTDQKEYADLKRRIYKKFPFFDGNALDAARFLYGNKVDPKDVVWNEGWITIEDIIDPYDPSADQYDHEFNFSNGPILEGSRNKTLSHYAGRILKKYGLETERSFEIFNEYVTKCEPPLSEGEVNAIWNSAVHFYKSKVMTSEGYIPPEKYNEEFEASSLKPDDYSDIGEAKVLYREYKDELKFTNATDYLRYDGDCWRENKQMAIGAEEEFLDLQLADAQDAVESSINALIKAGINEKTARAGGKALEKACEKPEQIKLYFMYVAANTYLKFVQKHRDYKYIVSTLNAAKPMFAIDVAELDKDPFLINTPDSTIDMEKGISGIKEHDPNDLITKITTCSPGYDGKEIWEDALNTFFLNDKELIDYVQMTIGVAAVGKVYQEHMIIAYGDGANGKSTFYNTIFRVMGNYAGKLSAEALTMNCKRNVKPEMAELKGKRLIIASEMDEGMRLNTATVKQLCSTDDIFAEKKYKDPFIFVPSHMLVLYTNHLPRVGANDDGIWRRLVVIPFNAKIDGKSDIKNYADYLYENAGSYIMTWIIEGAQKAIKANFKISMPSVVSDAIEAYREENDWLGHFLDECCDVDKTYTAKSGELYQSYRAYCMLNGEYSRSTTDFYGALEKCGYFRHKTKKGSMVMGLKLREGQDFLD